MAHLQAPILGSNAWPYSLQDPVLAPYAPRGPIRVPAGPYPRPHAPRGPNVPGPSWIHGEIK